MKKLPNSKMILSVALAVIFANTMHFALAQEQEAAIAPPPPAVWEAEALDPDAAPPPPSNQVLNNFSQRLREAERRPRNLQAAPIFRSNKNFARRSYQDRIEVCVNAVAQACDGHFTRKLTRALSRGTRDLVDSTTLVNALRGQGISRCGHYTAANGGLEMEAFVKGNQLILFSLPSPTEKDPRQAVCKHSVIAMPEAIADMKVTENKVWLVGGSRSVYYAGADFKVRKTDKTATTLIGVSPDGKQLTVSGPTGLFDANSEKSSDIVAAERAALNFSDDPRVSDAAASLLPAVNTIRR